jgi:hypothetical protein
MAAMMAFTAHLHAMGAAVGFERCAERVGRELAALQTRPRPLLAAGGDGAVDGVRRQALRALVARDRVQRGIHHHATHVEEHAAEGHRPRL